MHTLAHLLHVSSCTVYYHLAFPARIALTVPQLVLIDLFERDELRRAFGSMNFTLCDPKVFPSRGSSILHKGTPVVLEFIMVACLNIGSACSQILSCCEGEGGGTRVLEAMFVMWERSALICSGRLQLQNVAPHSRTI